MSWPTNPRHPPNPTVGTGGFTVPGANTTPVPTAPQAVNAPRMIDFTGGGGLTLQALEQRQADYAEQAAQPMPEIRDPTQGIAYLLNQFNANMGRSMAERQEAEGRSKVAELMTRMQPGTDEIAPNALSDIGAIDPELAQKIYFDLRARRAASAEKGVWVDIPTPEGETGQWQKNTVTNEFKKVGGGTEGSGMKPTDVSAMRGQVVGNQVYKDVLTTDKLYNALWSAASDKSVNGAPSRTSDIDLVYGLATMLDPGSVVREGDMVMVQKAQALPNWLVSSINSLMTGEGVFGDAERKQIMDTAYSRHKAQLDAYNNFATWYRDIAVRNKVNPEDIAQSFREPKRWGEEEEEQPDEPPPPEDLTIVKSEVMPDGSIKHTMSDGSIVTEPPPRKVGQ
jgi:hypothetical protein